MPSGKQTRKPQKSGPEPTRIGVISEHLMPSGNLPGTERSETIWTGSEGPPPGSWANRRAIVIGVLSWILVTALTVWLHLVDFDDFVSSFPYVLGAKLLVFAWVLFGVTILRPIFLRRSRNAPSREAKSRR